jgi:hypothetical protein
LISVQLIMMNKTALYFLALPLLFAACKSKCVEDLGIHASREAVVKPFDEITVSGPIKLIMRQDSSFKVVIDADSAIIDKVNAEVSGHSLSLKLDAKDYCGKDSIIISTGIGALKKINAEGASKIYTSSAINVGDLELILSGATKVVMDLNAAKLKTELKDGTAAIDLNGQSGSHEVKSKGAITLNAFSFISGAYNLDLEGTAKMKVNVLNDLKINTTGAVEIFYKGSPKNIQEKKTGTYKLEKVN